MPARCPLCGKETAFEGNPFRPFCGKRCKLIDLGDWISGTYRIAAEDEEEESSLDSKRSTDGKDSGND